MPVTDDCCISPRHNMERIADTCFSFGDRHVNLRGTLLATLRSTFDFLWQQIPWKPYMYTIVQAIVLAMEANQLMIRVIIHVLDSRNVVLCVIESILIHF